MRNMWKKTLSLVLAIGVAASMLAIGLAVSAEEPTLDNPGTDQVYLVNSDTKDDGIYTWANLDGRSSEEAQMRVDSSDPYKLMYVSDGDCFATVDTYDVGDLESISIWVANATNQNYVPIVAYMLDDDQELRQIGICAIQNKPDNWTAVEGKINVTDEAKALNIKSSRIYFKAKVPLSVHIEKIEIVGQKLGTKTITFTPDTVEKVDGQQKAIQHNFVTVSGLAPNPAGWSSDAVSNIYGDMTFTFLNVDLKDGLTNIKAKWGTIGSPYTHGDGFMEVYAVQRDTGFAYRIGKLHLPEYTTAVQWKDYANGFRVSHFEWDDESYRDLFTGRWDVKMVYKPSRSVDNIEFGGVYFYTEGEASAANEKGTDFLTSFTALDRILDTYIREDMVSNAEEAWEDYAAVQQKAHAVAQDINVRLEARKLYDDVHAKYATKLAEGSNDHHPNYQQYHPLWSAFDNLQLTFNSSYATVEDIQAKKVALEQAIAGVDPDNALAEAPAVYDVNFYRVIKYNTLLRDALETLDFYLEDLEDAVDEAEGIEEGQYTDESWQALQEAIEAGNDVLERVELDSKGEPTALPDSADVRTALTVLLAAKDGLTTYYAMLQEKHAAYYETYLEDSLEGKYTTDTWNAFATAMNDAADILDEGATATKDELKGALSALEAAKEALVRIDKPLSERVEAAKTSFSVQGKYTDATWAALQEALTQAEAILNKTANTEQEVTEAIAAIDAAVQALAKVDKALSAKVAEVTETYAAQGQYTDESWDALQKALTAAQTLLEKDACTQKEADDALAALETAVEGLKTEDASADPDTDGEDSNTPSGDDDEKVPVTGEAISLTVLGLLAASGAVLTLSKKRR